MFELTKLDTRKKANEGQFMQLKHPGTGAKLVDPDTKKPVGLYLKGRDSDEFERLNHEKNNARIKGTAEEASSESIRQNNIELIAALTTGWEGLGFNGDPEFSRENILGVYKSLPWVYEQANLWADDRANFI